MNINRHSGRGQSERVISTSADRAPAAPASTPAFVEQLAKVQSQPRTASQWHSESTSSDEFDFYAVSYYSYHTDPGRSRPTDFSVASNLLAMQNKSHREKHQYAALARLADERPEQPTTSCSCAIL